MKEICDLFFFFTVQLSKAFTETQVSTSGIHQNTDLFS